jgi:hypothetical protein
MLRLSPFRPRLFGDSDGTWVSYYGHDLTCELQLIGFNIDRAAVQLGVSLSWGAAAQDREKWRKLAARLPLAPVRCPCGNETHFRTRSVTIQ